VIQKVDKKKLLIVFGSSSLLAQKTVSFLKPFDVCLFISTKDKVVTELGNDQYHAKLEKVSVESIYNAFKQLLPFRRSEIEEIFVVSFAGISDKAIFKDLSQEDIDHLLSVNLNSNVYLTSAILQYFGVGNSSLVFISSTRALLGDRGLTMYSTTKHALTGLVKGISLEYGKFGFRANVLSLGVAPVGLVNKVPEKRLNEILKRSAKGRMIEIESIVLSLEHLRENQALNGSTQYCDGGYY
jgi:NAD(P)-dependent dehydrogenase (short-subunit alcohol dehydrogenase family)